MKKILFVDDFRNPEDYCYTKKDKVFLARTFDEAIEYLNSGEKFDEILLDHDLGEIGFRRDGYGIMCKIEELINSNALDPKDFTVSLLTSNPSGRIRMQQVIDKYWKD